MVSFKECCFFETDSLERTILLESDEEEEEEEAIPESQEASEEDNLLDLRRRTFDVDPVFLLLLVLFSSLRRTLFLSRFNRLSVSLKEYFLFSSIPEELPEVESFG